MFRPLAILRALGWFLVVLAATMAVPVLWGLVRRTGGWMPLVQGAGVTALAGGALAALGRRAPRELGQREALLLVVLVWFAAAAFGGLPFLFSPHFAGFTDAFFEAASGFTTTGATILADVEVLPEPIQFWRCFTHWIGGMGIVLLVIAILPVVGHGGMLLYRAEFSGARSDRLKPRIAETALALWKIYVALSVAEFVALRLAGMSPFDAICHTFSTLGTGGFSTRTASVGAFESPAVEWVIALFMFLAGISFIQHYRLFRERQWRGVLADYEVRAYALLVMLATAFVTASLVWQTGFGVERALRGAAFQVASIATTTGFTSENYELWSPLGHVVLLLLMYIGGCTGSTAGGIKISRAVLLARVVSRELKRIVERRGVFAVRLGGQPIPEPVVQSVLNLVYLALLINAVGMVLLAATGVDVLTSISAVIACMFNIGPGLGLVGPSDHYGHLPALAKYVLSVAMIAGRLEFYTLVVVLTPAFWRR
ncbi:MAG: potassium transporter TrkG [Vicinamibacterales bacterium]